MFIVASQLRVTFSVSEHHAFCEWVESLQRVSMAIGLLWIPFKSRLSFVRAIPIFPTLFD